jgi:hypothetical protein
VEQHLRSKCVFGTCIKDNQKYLCSWGYLGQSSPTVHSNCSLVFVNPNFQTLSPLNLFSGCQLIALTICVASEEKRDSLKVLVPGRPNLGLDTTAIPTISVPMLAIRTASWLIVRSICKATTDKATRSVPDF